MTAKQQSELDRAIEIARENGHKVFTATHRLTGTTVYTVRSHSDANMFHILYIQAGRIHCDCFASQHDRICSHAAAVRLFLIAQRDALASIEQQEAAQPSSCAEVEDMLAQHNEQERYAAQLAAREAERQQAIVEAARRRAEDPEAISRIIAEDAECRAYAAACEQADAMALLDREGPDDEWELDARIPLTTEQLQQGIYCEECGRFKSHCDDAGHANPPAPWSRMGQAAAQKREAALLDTEPKFHGIFKCAR